MHLLPMRCCHVHLLRELGHGEGAVLLVAAAGQRREADHEEVEAREGDQVDRQLAQVRVQLACGQQASRSASARSVEPPQAHQRTVTLASHPVRMQYRLAGLVAWENADAVTVHHSLRTGTSRWHFLAGQRLI
jgi:carotenoid cleavage dioxygenase-like enzyme